MYCVLFICLLCFVHSYNCLNELCVEKNVSCSYQLWTNNTDDACTMYYFLRNSSYCGDEFPEPREKSPTPKNGIIKIVPIVWTRDGRTTFQITAHNITWTNLKFRFKQQDVAQKCMKREFVITDPEISGEAYLSYDCPWSKSDFEDKIVDFEYAFGVDNKYESKRTFVMRVPKSELIRYYHTQNIKDLKVFSYVETTNLYHLVYKINTAPHVNVTSYEIYVNFTKENVTRINGPFVRGIEDAVLNVIDFGYDTHGLPGKYVFYTRPWECTKCGFSVAATVIIPETSTILTIGIVGVSCLIPIFLITLYMYFKVDSGIRPRVLLVTTPANNVHRTIGVTLANILKQKYQIETMMDILDITTSTNEIPSNWLKKSFEHATHIVILTSDHKPETSIYRNMDLVLFNLLNTSSLKICCKIEFPFTEQPTKFEYIFNQKFKLMRDYQSFINFICNRGVVGRIKDRILRKHLYHDLDVQINNYGRDKGCINSVECCELECDQNELNNLRTSSAVTLNVEDESDTDSREDLPQEVRQVTEDCLMDVENNSTSDESEISDTESEGIAINTVVLSMLEEVS